ncbi:hypothetical protein CBM2599_A140221 [Cupriavidus taiwanensis]|nr:hypothetical protein CBM2600_A120910 [Cupriavidus taiwanensis]SOY82653.1 hypothetical protein CBM2599_A140221 [Cupriavidus taiwanensis]
MHGCLSPAPAYGVFLFLQETRGPSGTMSPLCWQPQRPPIPNHRHELPVRPFLSRGLRRVLYRAVDRLAAAGHAGRQAGGRAVRAVAAGHALRGVRQPGPARVLRWPEAVGRDVRRFARSGAALADPARDPDRAASARLSRPVAWRLAFIPDVPQSEAI